MPCRHRGRSAHHDVAGALLRRASSRRCGCSSTAATSPPRPRSRPSTGCSGCYPTRPRTVARRTSPRCRPRRSSPWCDRTTSQARPASCSPLQQLAETVAIQAKIKASTKELKTLVLARDSTLMDLTGVGPVVAARVLADVGDVARFADRNRFASWTGTAPLDASSGEQIRHRLSRAGNRKAEPRHPHRRRLPNPTRHPRPDLLPAQARRGQDPDGSDALPEAAHLRRDLSTAPHRRQHPDISGRRRGSGRAPRGVTSYPARPASTRTPTLRISHFPDPHQRRYPPDQRP